MTSRKKRLKKLCLAPALDWWVGGFYMLLIAMTSVAVLCNP